MFTKSTLMSTLYRTYAVFTSLLLYYETKPYKRWPADAAVACPPFSLSASRAPPLYRTDSRRGGKPGAPWWVLGRWRWTLDHSAEHSLGRAVVHAAVHGGLVELLLHRRARGELCELPRDGRQRRARNMAVLPDTCRGTRRRGKVQRVQRRSAGVLRCRGARGGRTSWPRGSATEAHPCPLLLPLPLLLSRAR